MLRILPHGPKSLVIGASAGLLFGAYMALADATVFRSVIPAAQTAMVLSQSALERIETYIPYAIIDELVFRLVLMSVTVWLLERIAGEPKAWCFWFAILVTAFVYYPAAHWGYLATLDPVPVTMLREITLHGLAGVVWGYLYWRHGLASSIVGHISAHLSLQPLLSILFG